MLRYTLIYFIQWLTAKLALTFSYFTFLFFFVSENIRNLWISNLLILVTLHMTDAQTKYFKFERNPQNADNICQETDTMFTRQALNEVSCTSLCTEHSMCTSIFFRKATINCIACKTLVYPLLEATGFQHYSTGKWN